MNKVKLTSFATSVALVLGVLSGCNDNNDPVADDVSVQIDTTFAEISITAIKGSLINAFIGVEALNGTNLITLTEDARTDQSGDELVKLSGEPGFGIDGLVKVTITSNGESTMICDAPTCGDLFRGDIVSGSGVVGIELSTLAYLTVPYANPADSSADGNFRASVLTTMATQLIEQAMADGRNVSSPQLLELAQEEYSKIVLRALGYDAKNVNIFAEQVISAENYRNFVVDTTCVEESCTDTLISKTSVTLSMLNAAFANVAPGSRIGITLPAAFVNFSNAIAGDGEALLALRQPLHDALSASTLFTELGLSVNDVVDLKLPLEEDSASSGPVQEVTTVENMATAVITARNRIGDGESEAMAFDRDPQTKWLDHNDWAGAPTVEDPSWIQVQFQQAHAVSSLFITSANDGPNRDPENFALLASNDGTNWVTLAEFIGESFDERFERKGFRFSNGLEYTFYRLNITKNKGDDTLMQLAEIAFVGPIYPSVDHTDPVGTGTITASNRIGDGEAETMAFDNDPDTKWLDHNDWSGPPTEEDPSWVQVDFVEAVAVNVLAITSANDADSRDPENFNLQASNDGGQSWKNLASWIGESFEQRFERRLFSFSNQLGFTSYRVNITKNKGDDTLMQLAEIELIGPKLAGLNHGMTAGVIITARDRIGDTEAESMAFDGDVNTKWLDHNGWSGVAPTVEDPSWAQIELPAAVVVNELAIVSAGDADSRDPENFDLLASNDGINWIILSRWIGESFDERLERKQFNFGNDLGFSFYRLNITKNKGDDGLMQIAEIELIGPQHQSIDHSSTPGVVITARNRIGDAEAESMAFDDDVNTKWLDHNDWAGAPTEENPSWVQVDLPEAKIVSSVAITSANDADNRDPENFNIQGSNDGGATWVTISTWIGESWDDRLQRKLFDFGNGFSFANYRINITKNKGDDTLMQIAEIELIGPEL